MSDLWIFSMVSFGPAIEKRGKAAMQTQMQAASDGFQRRVWRLGVFMDGGVE
jgi:hypothetical protein